MTTGIGCFASSWLAYWNPLRRLIPVYMAAPSVIPSRITLSWSFFPAVSHPSLAM